MYLKCPNIYGIHIHVYPISDNILNTTVLPAKSDSDVMFCLQSNQGIRIDISLLF